MKVNWESDENQHFLNPRFPSEQAQELTSWIKSVGNQFKGHLFLLSSGTTAKSKEDLKWIALKKESFLVSAKAVNQHLESDEKDVWIHTLPDFHVGGLGIWARSELSGARVVKLSQWNVEDFVQVVEQNRGSLTSLVPAQIFDLVNKNVKSPKSLRAILVGGGALSPALHRRAVELEWPILTTYGMTEACSQIATLSLSQARKVEQLDKDDTASPYLKILPHVQISQLEDGRIKLKSDSLLTAWITYTETGPRVVDPKENGWYLTQDRVELNGNSLRVLGRQGDFVKIGGESVEVGRLREILDGIVMQMSVSADVALLPVPDQRLGHVIHLLSDQNLSKDCSQKIIDQFNQKVIPFERIREWDQLKYLPRTDLGKLIPSECLKLVLDNHYE